ncbi:MULTISPECIES: QueT transporter family protein [unclassified Clostridium]|uniref:QueT transporter family protein n=1 Tax=unclassified Clostridium TaxID=2614128 RepID=UPI0025C2E42B|nr:MULTISPECIES: QueT transporter family protein [unclassified Clostridium]
MDTKKLLKVSLVAAIYAVITYVLAPISFGAIQFRLSEIMTLLAFIDPLYVPALTLGCGIANLFSPVGVIDVIVGTAATFIATFAMSKSKNMIIASLYPTIVNAIMIGAMLYYAFNLPLVLSALQVGVGEFVVVTIIGVPVFKLVLKDKSLRDILKISE